MNWFKLDLPVCSYLALLLFIALSSRTEAFETRQSSNRTDHYLTVRIHSSLSAFQAAHVRRILDYAGRPLRRFDIPTALAEVECPVYFHLKGKLTTFSNRDYRVISTPIEMKRILTAPGDVKIVKGITYCGGEHPGALGCGATNQSIIMIAKTYTDLPHINNNPNFNYMLNGSTLAHEFGHVQSLKHFCDYQHSQLEIERCRSRRFPNVMFYTNASGSIPRSHINAFQCRLFRKSYRAQVPDENVGISDSLLSDHSLTVEAFVKQLYFEGVDYSQARKFKQEEVRKLVMMLEDRDEQVYWPNILGVLGAIGNKEASKALVGFIKQNLDDRSEAQPLEPTRFQAILSAIVALGWAQNQMHQKEAESLLSFLVGDAIKLTEAGFDDQNNRQNKEAILDRIDIGKVAITAIGLSGTSGGNSNLTIYQEYIFENREMKNKNAKTLISLIDDSRKKAKFIDNNGLTAYYLSLKK